MLLEPAGALPLIGLLALLGLTVLLVRLIFSRWVAPLRIIAEDARLIATSNPGHRSAAGGGGEVRALAAGINLLAERFQALHARRRGPHPRGERAARGREEHAGRTDVEADPGRAGVQSGGSNPSVQSAGPAAAGGCRRGGVVRATGSASAARSSAFVDAALIKHALDSIDHRLAAGEQNLLVPFVATRPGGRMLSTHLVPILDHDRGLRGYILTFEDVTRRFGAESRRGTLLQSLTEGQRSAIGGIRAAIETVLTFPEMDESGRQQFFEVIRDEALKVSQHLDRLEEDYRNELKVQLPVEDVLGSDLLACGGA